MGQKKLKHLSRLLQLRRILPVNRDSKIGFLAIALISLFWIGSATVALSQFTPSQSTPSKIATIAQQTTVRILSDSGAGSGVLVKQQGNTYTVLTCAHVVAERDRYTVSTLDGNRYPMHHLMRSSQLDIALGQFTSSQAYQVATFGNAEALSVGERVYAVGFPNWRTVSSTEIANTRNWGQNAFSLTTGQVSMLLPQALQAGYQLGYTNDVENGMSGGAVLNEQGQVVGINGRLKYPFQGISAYLFRDGSMPSEELFRKLESLSWAIPSFILKNTF